MQLWQPVKIAEGTTTHWQIGTLKLWIRRLNQEWQIAIERDKNDEEVFVGATSDVSVPNGIDWTRWVAPTDDDTLQLVPVMPDRPVIVRPESPMRFPTGADAVLYASVPICVRVMVGKENAVTLTDIPTLVLSNSWLGDQMQGELCYSMRTSARRSLASFPPKVHRASCTLHIRNESEIELEFTRLSIRVQHLNVYWSEKRLWTNKVLVTYRNEDQDTKLDYETTAPSMHDKAEVVQLCEAREPVKKSIFHKTFIDLKAFTTY